MLHVGAAYECVCVCVNMRGLFNCMVFFQTHSWHKQAACLMDEKSRLKTVCHFWLLCLCSNHITCLLIPRHLTWVLAAINFNKCIYRIIKFWVLVKMLREVKKKPHHLPIWLIWFELSRYTDFCAYCWTLRLQHNGGRSQYSLMFFKQT